KLGTTGKGIEINKMAVNPASRTAYFAVRKLDGKVDLLLTLDGDGKVRDFALDNVKHTTYALPGKSPITKITDLTWAGDRVLVAAQTNETFGSNIVSLMVKSPESACYSTETFHVAHNKWVTKAPIRT